MKPAETEDQRIDRRLRTFDRITAVVETVVGLSLAIAGALIALGVWSWHAVLDGFRSLI